MIDALQPFLEDKKQTLAWVCAEKTCNDYGADWSDLDGGDLPPFRRTEEEITECLDEMITRIRARACRLSGILN